MNIEKIKECIDRYSIISFDVFDTLLLRPFVIPSDMFEYIEEKYDIKDFAKKRKNVKCLEGKEKTIEDIYENLPSQYMKFMEIELLEEMQLIYSNSLLKSIYEYALSSKKRIVIISDTYFHQGFVERLLKKNGYQGYEKVYCSCDFDETKCDGRLFTRVVRDLKCTPIEILHIGDNEVSDYAVPKSMKINSIRIDRSSEKYFKYRPYLEGNIDNYWDSVMVKICADEYSGRDSSYTDKQECWYRFGFDIAGPICWAFAKWIEDVIENDAEISDLAFVARDGYLIKKMYDKMEHKREITTHYIYAPRILTTLLQRRYNEKKDIQELTAEEEKIVNEVYNLSEMSEDEKTEFIGQLGQKYIEYLRNEKFGFGVVGVIDSTTNNLSSQKLVSIFSERMTCGLYWFASQFAFSNKYQIKTCQSEHYVVVESVDLFELIFKSPEPTIRYFSKEGKIVFNEMNESEKERIENFKYIEEGAMNFFESISSKEICGYAPAKVINEYLNRFCKNPLVNERKYIETGCCSGGIANTIMTSTKVFSDSSSKINIKQGLKKEVKQWLTKHPKLFILLRTLYHKIKKMKN